jgi:hypothetical protein
MIVRGPPLAVAFVLQPKTAEFLPLNWNSPKSSILVFLLVASADQPCMMVSLGKTHMTRVLLKQFTFLLGVSMPSACMMVNREKTHDKGPVETTSYFLLGVSMASAYQPCMMVHWEKTHDKGPVETAFYFLLDVSVRKKSNHISQIN